MLQSYYKLAKWQNKHAYELFLYFGLSIKRYFCRNFVPLSLYNYVGALVLSLIAFLFFGEGRELNFSFYVGIVLIVLSVSLQTLRSYKMAKQNN